MCNGSKTFSSGIAPLFNINSQYDYLIKHKLIKQQKFSGTHSYSRGYVSKSSFQQEKLRKTSAFVPTRWTDLRGRLALDRTGGSFSGAGRETFFSVFFLLAFCQTASFSTVVVLRELGVLFCFLRILLLSVKLLIVKRCYKIINLIERTSFFSFLLVTLISNSTFFAALYSQEFCNFLLSFFSNEIFFLQF